MAYYEQIYTGGNSSANQKMSVYLYPWDKSNSSLTNAVDDGGIAADAIRDAAEDLLNYGSIEYYEILRFRVEDYNDPKWGDIDNDSYTDIENKFRDYLDDTSSSYNVPNNGTGENLYSQVGVHQLIHAGATGCTEDTGTYAPNGAGAENWGQTAFLEGRVAWSPVCSNSGLTRNAAIQETLHMFCDPMYDDTWTGTIDSRTDNDTQGEEDQHTLGKVDYYNSVKKVTPMLTYHWDDQIKSGGDCPSYSLDPTANGHRQVPTFCTKEAIKKTADERVPSNLQ